MSRLSRECVITEKIDGTNAQLFITEDGDLFAGSRTRWVTPEDDNYGFAAWAYANKHVLLGLGPGQHFGEWWGRGINRGYGLSERRFSLFNTRRWALFSQEPKAITTENPTRAEYQQVLPEIVGLVPVLYNGVFTTDAVTEALERLKQGGSVASPGFMSPEGVVVYHMAAGVGFKKTIIKDEEPKGKYSKR